MPRLRGKMALCENRSGKHASQSLGGENRGHWAGKQQPSPRQRFGTQVADQLAGTNLIVSRTFLFANSFFFWARFGGSDQVEKTDG